MERETKAKTTLVVRGMILMVVIGERRDAERKAEDQHRGDFLLHLANGRSLKPVPS
ncbi:MAG: hypothetical protein ABR951_10860 [Candidatus Aminicenantales bacterium]|jgi:hypothetical protein